jgi:hypothetical protein
VVGTPKYMGSGQFRGQPIDHRAARGDDLRDGDGGWLPYDDEGAARGQLLDDAVLNARMS